MERNNNIVFFLLQNNEKKAENINFCYFYKVIFLYIV